MVSLKMWDRGYVEIGIRIYCYLQYHQLPMNKVKVLGLNLFTSLYFCGISTDTGCKSKLETLYN